MTTRARFASVTATLLAAFTLSACGDDSGSLGEAPSGEDGTISESPTVSETPGTGEAPPEDTPPADGDETTLEAWFVSEGATLLVTERTIEAVPGIAAAALEELFAGPVEAEQEAGMGTAIPTGTTLLGLDIAEGIATVDLSAEFEESSGSAAEIARLAQLVFTLTQFESVEGVILEIEGEPLDELGFGSHGLVYDGPMTRADFEQLLPPIVVESPGIGETVSSPVTISGTANVFEATVSISIVDADGNELVRTFTTATCGSGCRGTWSKAVPFEVSGSQPATIEVYESSAEDGSKLHTVEIPVVLEG